MDINLSTKIKELYDYIEKLYSFSQKLSNYLDTVYKDFQRLEKNDEVALFLKELAEKDIYTFNLELKRKAEKVNTPIRIVKKGFKQIYKEKVEEIIDFLNYIIRNLDGILHKIQSFQENLAGKRTNYEPFKIFMNKYQEDLNTYLEKAVKRITHEKIEFFKNELEKIKSIEDPEEIILFLQTFKANVNRFITEQLYNNIDGIYKSLKDTLYKKVDEYLNEIGLPADKKEVVLYKIETLLNSYEHIYPLIYFDIPELPKNFFDPKTEYTSLMDRFSENIQSLRFFLIFIVGLIISFWGIYDYLETDEDIGLISAVVGIVIILIAFIDAMFLNKKYIKIFLDKRKEFLLLGLEKKLEEIEKNVYEFLLEQKMSLINSINEVLSEELKVYSSGGEKIENLKKNIEQYKEEAYNLLKIAKDKLENDIT